MRSLRSRKLVAIFGGLAAGAAASVASADPLVMDPVSFPVDVESLASTIAAAGGIMLVALFGVAIGFALIKKLKRRLTAAV